MEHALSSMGLTSLVIARPSLLDGNRKVLGQTDRPGEGIGPPRAATHPGELPCHLGQGCGKFTGTGSSDGQAGVVTLMSGQMQEGQ